MKCFSILILLLVACVELGSCAKILGIFPMPAHSHFTLGFRIMKELADKGHEVHFINPYPQKEKIKNFHDISVEQLAVDIKKFTSNLYEFGDMSFMNQLEFVREMGAFLVEGTLKQQNVQKLLNSQETFDLIFLENFFAEGLTIFQHKFKCPLVLLGPGPPTIYNNYIFANPSPSSYIPNIVSGLTAPMSFWERTKNFLYDIIGELHLHLVVIPEHNEIVKKYVKDAPELKNILYNASLMLITTHPSLNDPVPLQSNIKEIGGYHVSVPKELPNDIKKYLDDATEGVILFSMGSNLRSADFPKDKLDSVLNAFGKLKQRVLWKFESDLPNKPKNVRIMKWLPQNDIMAHPNVKVFIGHGGLLSTTEAVYHGVPMVGVPVFWDQKINMKSASQKGFAVHLPFKELNEEKFSNALNEVLNNPSYREQSKFRSQVMHGEPMTQLDAAVFWIEYVIKFKGAPHLRSSGLDLTWYQRLSIDVILLIILADIILFLIFYYVIKKIFRNKHHPKKSNTKIKKS